MVRFGLADAGSANKLHLFQGEGGGAEVYPKGAWQGTGGIAGSRKRDIAGTFLGGAYLHEMVDADGNFLKWGITQDMGVREIQYIAKRARGIQLFEKASGTRADMARMERFPEQTQPGPQNLQPWAVKAWNSGLGECHDYYFRSLPRSRIERVTYRQCDCHFDEGDGTHS